MLEMELRRSYGSNTWYDAWYVNPIHIVMSLSHEASPEAEIDLTIIGAGEVLTVSHGCKCKLPPVRRVNTQAWSRG